MSNINFNAVYGLISKLISIIGPALKSVKDLDAELAALKKTTDASEAELKQVYYDSYDMAKQLGLTTKEIISQTTWWTKLGYSIKDAMKIIKSSEALNSLSPGLDMGEAYKTIAARIHGYDAQTQAPSKNLENISGDIAALTKSPSTPDGISLFTDETNQSCKSVYQILKEISGIYDKLSDKNKAELLEKLAGSRSIQAESLLTEFQSFETALSEIEKSSGSAGVEISDIEQTLEHRINALKETWTKTAQELINPDDLGSIVEGLTEFSEALGLLLNKIGILGTAGIGVGLFEGIKNVGRL